MNSSTTANADFPNYPPSDQTIYFRERWDGPTPKAKAKPRKQRIVYQDESSSDEEEVVVVKRRSRPKRKAKVRVVYAESSDSASDSDEEYVAPVQTQSAPVYDHWAGYTFR